MYTPLYYTLISDILTCAHTLNAQAAANFANALTKLLYQHVQALSRLYKVNISQVFISMSPAFDRNAEMFAASHICMICNAAASLEVRCAETLRRLWNRFVDDEQFTLTLTPQGVSMLLNCAAKLDVIDASLMRLMLCRLTDIYSHTYTHTHNIHTHTGDTHTHTHNTRIHTHSGNTHEHTHNTHTHTHKHTPETQKSCPNEITLQGIGNILFAVAQMHYFGHTFGWTLNAQMLQHITNKISLHELKMELWCQMYLIGQIYLCHATGLQTDDLQALLKMVNVLRQSDIRVKPFAPSKLHKSVSLVLKQMNVSHQDEVTAEPYSVDIVLDV